MKSKSFLVMVVALSGLLAACHREQAPAAGEQEGVKAEKAADAGAKKEEPTDWNPAAMKVTEQLADKVRAAGMACDEFEPSAFGLYDDDYKKRLPMALAVASCDTDGDEDLTFEVFEDAQHTRQFMETKQAYLCKRAADMQLPDFPGLPYVDGGAWIVEPDEKLTADKLAPILGGEAKIAACVKK